MLIDLAGRTQVLSRDRAAKRIPTGQQQRGTSGDPEFQTVGIQEWQRNYVAGGAPGSLQLRGATSICCGTERRVPE
jgi:hypothetical protein